MNMRSHSKVPLAGVIVLLILTLANVIAPSGSMGMSLLQGTLTPTAFVYLPLVVGEGAPAPTGTPTPTATPTPTVFPTMQSPAAGHWTGTTEPIYHGHPSKPMSFDVSMDGTQWLTFTLSVAFEGCGRSGTATIITSGPGTIASNHFSYSSSSYQFNGTLAATTATGYFDFDNYKIPVTSWCDYYINEQGAWTANSP